MPKEYRTTPNNVALPYRWALGKYWTGFFDGLKKRKILGTKCKKCGKVLVPARAFCPYCLEDMNKWVEVSQVGTVRSWNLVRKSFYGQVKEPPYLMALIRLDGADCDLVHFLGGLSLSDTQKVKKKIGIGTKVKAVWARKREGTIYDIAYFKPV